MIEKLLSKIIKLYAIYIAHFDFNLDQNRTEIIKEWE